MTAEAPDGITERVRYYRTICGLPCGPHANSGRIILRTWDIGAITLPMPLGEGVHEHLVAANTPGPVIGHDNDRWTLLTRPHRLDGDMMLAARLHAINAHLVPCGATVLLPGPDDEAARRMRWILKPRDMFRPAMETVLAALDYVVEAGR
ncbi:hypothetical protein [Nocardia sp. NPDC051570]|uniref:hypothetical protein n=1 Tax=Nocardia sp. NPDC051570 TaxID=3364324 RepID=UPI0037A5633D